MYVFVCELARQTKKASLSTSQLIVPSLTRHVFIGHGVPQVLHSLVTVEDGSGVGAVLQDAVVGEGGIHPSAPLDPVQVPVRRNVLLARDDLVHVTRDVDWACRRRRQNVMTKWRQPL